MTKMVIHLNTTTWVMNRQVHIQQNNHFPSYLELGIISNFYFSLCHRSLQHSIAYYHWAIRNKLVAADNITYLSLNRYQQLTE
jgi:hypothetical protein